MAGHKTVNEIAGAHEVHPSQVAKCKAEAANPHVRLEERDLETKYG